MARVQISGQDHSNTDACGSNRGLCSGVDGALLRHVASVDGCLMGVHRVVLGLHKAEIARQAYDRQWDLVEMSDYFESQSKAKVHHGDIDLDDNIVAQFPAAAAVKSCRGHGASNWNQTARVDLEANGKEQTYFLKLTTGAKGGPMVHGEYESMSLLHQMIPESIPKPLAWGRCKESDRHFILLSFHDLKTGRPEISSFVRAVAELHTLSCRPGGKFGFPITTYNGTLAQDNTWTDTWEDFYVRGMKRMLDLEKQAAGPSNKLDEIAKPFLEKVIPRLLRPLESDGRRIDPVLIHGDLWIGNVSVQRDTGRPMMFDASAFWGHHEYELSTMRPLDDDWGRECLRKYHELMPKSEPREDWDGRNALYATRTYIHDAALYPEVPKFRTKLIDEMRKLVKQYGT